ncbi:MAG TPA: 4Fe-4S binding protein [Nitrospirota bacterium]|nr:4Fe-4S binding protein [Nitrospirota bacterium]
MLAKIMLVSAVTIGGVLLAMWIISERGRLLRKTTWATIKAQGLKNNLNFKSLHAYIYARWTKEYIYVLRNIIFPTSDDRGRQKWADRYHGKVITNEQARAVITLNRDIPLHDLEQVIPYPTARNIVLNGPPDVVAYECGCRNSKQNHCSPSQVCMVIGKPFTDFMVDHHPQKTRRLSQTEALDLLEQEHERGHLHSAWFKDVLMNRFYSICNCCKCCCAGTESMNKYGMNFLASSGYVSQVDTSKCKACGTCEKTCHFNAMSVGKTASVNWDKCMGCGSCEVKCPNHAISLVRDEKKGLPFDVRLMA